MINGWNVGTWILKWLYAMKVMTSFGYEIMLPRGFWFQTLDVNKPWRQIPADRFLFFFFFFFFFLCVCSHIFFCLITPRQYEEEKFRSNQTTLLKKKIEAANSRVTELVQASYKNRAYGWVISQNIFCLTHACYNANAPRQYPVPLSCTPCCVSAVCFGEHMFNSWRSD